MHKKANPKKFEFAKMLRKSATPQEKVRWDCLRNKKLGAKFRRQHPIDEYVVDFICVEKKLIVEIDGYEHTTEQGKESDKLRDALFAHYGYQVLRFYNSQVENKLEDVLEQIREVLSS